MVVGFNPTSKIDSVESNIYVGVVLTQQTSLLD
jgi:hypothetical protein